MSGEEDMVQATTEHAGTASRSPGQQRRSGYPVILGGDHAAFEAEWAASGRPDNERPDWPLPSFSAVDWAAAFCKIANGFGFKDAEGKSIDEGWMISWFANALMRGYDQRSAEGFELARQMVERCIELAENPGFIEARDTEWDEGVNYAKRFIAAAIRADMIDPEAPSNDDGTKTPPVA